MKRLLVGTRFGRMARYVRDVAECGKASVLQPEVVGTLANDCLAAHIVTRLCESRRTFLDVGAHIGSVVAEAGFHCPGAHIEAVEAIPDKVAHLKKTFPRVVVHGVALGERSGEATFNVMTGGNSGYSSLGTPRTSGQAIAIRVPIRRLDDLDIRGRIDVMKIDVEGAELGVLRGAESVVAEHRPTIMFESGPQLDDGLGYSKQDLWQWFADRSYAVIVPNRLAHEDPGLGLEGFVESHLYPRRTTNFFGVAVERRNEIRDKARRILRFGPDQ